MKMIILVAIMVFASLTFAHQLRAHPLSSASRRAACPAGGVTAEVGR
jgi:hypothetical protein